MHRAWRALRPAVQQTERQGHGRGERESEREKAYSWTTEDGIIIECEIEVPEISNFCNVSLDARDFSRCRIQSLSLQGNGRCNWRKIDAKGVGPDEESERERTSSEVRTINTCSLRRTVSPSPPLSFSPFFRSTLFHVSLPCRARLSAEPRGVILYTGFSSSPRGSGFVAPQVVLTYLSGSSFLLPL